MLDNFVSLRYDTDNLFIVLERTHSYELYAAHLLDQYYERRSKRNCTNNCTAYYYCRNFGYEEAWVYVLSFRFSFGKPEIKLRTYSIASDLKIAGDGFP